MLLMFFAIGQSMYMTSQIDVSSIDEPAIGAATTVSDINAAHITETPTLPVVHEYKTDLISHPYKTIVYYPAPIIRSFHFLPHDMESYGFLDVKKYQSNYLS